MCLNLLFPSLRKSYLDWISSLFMMELQLGVATALYCNRILLKWTYSVCAKGRCSCKGYTEELFVAQCLHQVSDSMYPAWYYNNDDDNNNNNNNNNYGSWRQGFLKYEMIWNNLMYNLWKNHTIMNNIDSKSSSNRRCQSHNLHQVTCFVHAFSYISFSQHYSWLLQVQGKLRDIKISSRSGNIHL